MAYFDFDYFSECVCQSIHGVAIIPNGARHRWNGAEPPYKTLYLLPGHSDHAMHLVRMSNIDVMAEKLGIAVIIPDGLNSFYLDRNDDSRFGTLIGEELVSLSRKWFRLSDKREDTFLGGMSMGGFGAIYNACKYPDTFSKIAALCPPCENLYLAYQRSTGKPKFSNEYLDELFGSSENFSQNFALDKIIEASYKSGKMPELFLGIGKDDKSCGTGVKKMECFLKQAEIPFEYHEVEGAHDFVFMNNIYPFMFDFLLGANRE